MMEITLHGTDYALIGQSIVYTVQGIDSATSVTWYKNGVVVPLSPKETNPLELNLYDVEAPAQGVYYAKVVYEGVTYETNTITLVIGRSWRTPEVQVAMPRNRVDMPKGQTLNITPVCIVYPKFCTHSANWLKNDVSVSDSNNLTVELLEDSNFGAYEHVVTVDEIGGYQATTFSTYIRVVDSTAEGDEDDSTRYIHDLKPGRDAGFIWVGWWVIDEIKQAVKDDFDWLSDPRNSRFTYPEELYTLSVGFKKWADLDIQESRNGYILNKKDIT